MIVPELKSAIRSIIRKKATSVISILGLGIGLGCIIILLALIVHEKSFDRFMPDFHNVYRIVLGGSAQTHFPLAEEMAGEFPEVKDYFRYYQANPLQLRVPGTEFSRERGFGFADPSIFRMTGIRFISGTPAGSINEVAISDDFATRYFGNLSPVGSVLQVKFSDGISDLTVSGVYKSFPSNSTLNPALVADIELSGKMFRQFQRSLGVYGNAENQQPGWKDAEFLSYILMDKASSLKELSGKMEKYKEFINDENKDKLEFTFQPVTEIYLGSGDISGGYFLRRGNPEELKYYEVISVLILIISIANYILLSRAGFSDRVHEMGTRKVFGASNRKIRKLIILESGIIVLVSLLPAILIIDSGMEFVNDTLNKTLTSQVFLTPALWILLVLVVILSGTISGWLIGLNYSKLSALRLLSGRDLRSGRNNRWKYSFLVLHFTIFMVLTSGVITVVRQIRFSRSEYKGINPENILVTELNSDELKKSFNTICNEIEKIPGVEMSAGGSFIPPFGNYLPINLALTTGEKVRFDGLIIGEGMTELLGIEVIDGSSFGPYKPGVPEVLINESSAKQYNVKAGENILAFKVKGIVRDFNAHSLHTLIQPMVILQQNPEKMGLIAIKTTGKNDDEVIKRLKELYTRISPDEIFEVSYLTDQVDNFYSRERDQARIMGAFSLLAMILLVMGLFGISLISITKRTKETGIRKVNGASISEVLFMINIDFIRWIVVSFVISVPVSVYIFSQWMNRFAYKTQQSWWIYAIAGLAAMMIAVLTVSWQSWRAATKNPVESLRYE